MSRSHESTPVRSLLAAAAAAALFSACTAAAAASLNPWERATGIAGQPMTCRSGPVDHVSAVDLALIQSEPPSIRVSASGEAGTPCVGLLIPVLSLHPPKDGIYEMLLYTTPAERPGDPQAVQAASYFSKFPADLAGIRIVASQNCMEAFLRRKSAAQLASGLCELAP
jgi:hypothetical protein